MNKLLIFFLCCPVLFGCPALVRAQTPVFSGRPTSWHEGFERYDFLMDTATLAITPYDAPAGEGFGVKDPPAGFRRCIVVIPHQPAPGNPWSWRGCYWDHQPQTEIELLKRGFFICYISANATLAPGRTWDAFYAWLTHEKGLSAKPAFIGMSRGGEYEYRWATTHPAAVSCIYADNPAVDRESLTLLGRLAANDVPLLHVCGSIDPLYWGSTLAVENIYHAFGGRISVIVKEGFGHHPHSLRDAGPIADFMEQSFRETAAASPDFVKAVYTGPGMAGAAAAGTSTWYYPSSATRHWAAAEKTWLTERGPYFSGAYARYQLLIPGVDAFTTVIVPRQAAPGRPWILRADYVTPEDRVTQGLLAKGWTIVTGAVPFNYNGPVPAQWNAIYAYLTGYGFAAKPVLMGRGGAAGEVMGWAIANPSRVAGVYAENPLLESRLMLDGKAPLDTLAPLAKAGVPLLFVCSEELQPPGQESEVQVRLAAARYKGVGGKVTVRIVKSQDDLPEPEDLATVLGFIER